MKADLIERLRARAAGIRQLRRQTPADIRDAELDETAAAALEAKESEGERRGLERAAEVADAIEYNYDVSGRQEDLEDWEVFQRREGGRAARRVAAAIRALIPEAPAREGNPKADPRYPALLADAKARVRNENLDGSPRRHAFTPPQDHREG